MNVLSTQTLLSLPDVVKNSEQLQQLVEYIGWCVYYCHLRSFYLCLLCFSLSWLLSVHIFSMIEIKQVVFVKVEVSFFFFAHSKSNGSDAVLEVFEYFVSVCRFLTTHADTILKTDVCHCKLHSVLTCLCCAPTQRIYGSHGSSTELEFINLTQRLWISCLHVSPPQFSAITAAAQLKSVHILEPFSLF